MFPHGASLWKFTNFEKSYRAGNKIFFSFFEEYSKNLKSQNFKVFACFFYLPRRVQRRAALRGALLHQNKSFLKTNYMVGTDLLIPNKAYFWKIKFGDLLSAVKNFRRLLPRRDMAKKIKYFWAILGYGEPWVWMNLKEKNLMHPIVH